MTLAIAVLSVTRDRIDYTKHCFDSLHKFAGCQFDHYVFDNGSNDGTQEWLENEYDPTMLVLSPENVGRCKALNRLLDETEEMDDYDVIVMFDNDCELTQPDTVGTISELTVTGGCILSPRILGLRNPPQPFRELVIDDEVILDIPQIGGIYSSAPAFIYTEGYRHNEDNPLYGREDVDLCGWFRTQGGTCGYVKRFEAWHYETTDGQHARYPEYFERSFAEGAPR